MNYFFLRFVYPLVLGVLWAVVLLIMLVRSRLHKPLLYRYSLGSIAKKRNVASNHWYKTVFYWSRFIVLFVLAFLIAKPQLVDSRSKVTTEGIDIVLVLDVSGSMQFQDYDDDERSRFDVARAEAMRFVELRHNDAIGLVIFGRDAVSRCPLTMDKRLLKDVLDELKLGVIDADGTMLITALVTAANRLKHSGAKTKVIILLTDGEPSEGDMDPSVGIDVAKKMNIKIYTVGIGSEQEQMFMHPLYGLVTKPKVNKELLTTIAKQTGGQYFMAHNARDMRTIYDTIDVLEKTEHEAPLFSIYHDLFMPFVFIIMCMLFIELFLSTFTWFAL